jgi:putative addiction module component (TIGR02574 family)
MSPSVMEQALALPLEERRKLMLDLWRTVEAESPVEPISEDERHLLDQRIEAAQAHPNDVEPWSAVRERLLGDR